MQIAVEQKIENSQIVADALSAILGAHASVVDFELERRGGDLNVFLTPSYGDRFTNATLQRVVRALRREGLTICGVMSDDRQGNTFTSALIVCTTFDAFLDVESEVCR